MHRIAILFILLPFNYAAYLPSLFWDTSNPILDKQFWHEVVQVKIYDYITFICPNDIIYIKGSERMITDEGFQNVYVKEVPADIKTFDGACDTSDNSTSIFIYNCDKPKKFNHKKIQINSNQADPLLPKFKPGKDYMFFATSDGRKESLTNKTSKICTIVFRIHFSKKEVPSPSCPLFGRKNVCEKKIQPNTKPPKTKECKDIIPQELNTRTIDNKVVVSWKVQDNIECNITYYTVCYRENLTEPCREIMVPAKHRKVTLCELTADRKYIVQVRAHTAKGPGDYSTRKTFKADGKKGILCMISHGEAICCREIKSIMNKKIEAEKVLCAPGNNLPPACCKDILKEVKKYVAAYEAMCLNNTVPCTDSNPLGMQSGKILDSAITASSIYSGHYYPYFARLKKNGSSCSWAPTGAGRVGSWLQVDLGQKTTVTRFATQGSCYSGFEWPTSYSIAYSNNGNNWTDYEESGNATVFQGNNDKHSIVTHTFKTHINARYIRVLPKSWKGWPTMRLELYGC